MMLNMHIYANWGKLNQHAWLNRQHYSVFNGLGWLYNVTQQVNNFFLKKTINKIWNLYDKLEISRNLPIWAVSKDVVELIIKWLKIAGRTNKGLRYQKKKDLQHKPVSLMVVDSLSPSPPPLSLLGGSTSSADIMCMECPPSEIQKISVSAQALWTHLLMK